MKKILLTLAIFICCISAKAQFSLKLAELETTVQYARCINYEDNLFGGNATLLWDTNKNFLIGVGAGLYNAYEDLGLELNITGKKHLAVHNNIHPFIECAAGTTILTDETDFSVLVHPKFGFEFPYYKGSFTVAVGYRVDYFPYYEECAHDLSVSFGYTFDLKRK